MKHFVISPCLHECHFIGKICLALPTGMQRGGGFLGGFAFCFSLPVLGDSDTLPDHNVFLFLILFRSIPLLGFSSISFLFLSLMQHFAAMTRTKETRKTTRTRLLGITQSATTKQPFASFLDKQKLKYPIIAYDTLINICQ
jgi:hypothetical protein